jgi:hypothetical protein
MFNLFLLWFGVLARLFRTRRALLCENLVLRQQLVVLERRRPRPHLKLLDKVFWVAVRRLMVISIPSLGLKTRPILAPYFITSA